MKICKKSIILILCLFIASSGIALAGQRAFAGCRDIQKSVVLKKEAQPISQIQSVVAQEKSSNHSVAEKSKSHKIYLLAHLTTIFRVESLAVVKPILIALLAFQSSKISFKEAEIFPLKKPPKSFL
jgi:hypothetical protein